MTKYELLKRTKTYALRVIKAVQALPRNDVGDVLGRIDAFLGKVAPPL